MRAYICDDVPELRRLLRAVFAEDPAIEVVGEAGDGATAVRDIEVIQPDVVLLDLAMPGLDGLEALGCIRDVAPDTCVIVFSGFTAERIASVALGLGADHYVEKGEELAELTRMVRDCKTVAA